MAIKHTIYLCETIKDGKTTYLKRTFEGNRTLGFVKISREKFNNLTNNASRLDSFFTKIDKNGAIRHFKTAVFIEKQAEHLGTTKEVLQEVFTIANHEIADFIYPMDK